MPKRGRDEIEELPQRSRRAPRYLDDYITEKITRRNISCNLEEVKKHRENMDDLIDSLEGLILEQREISTDDLITEIENMQISAMDRKVDELKGKQQRIGGQKGGAIMGMNASALVMYLIADAIKEVANIAIEQLTKLLNAGVKVLQFLSNKDSCAELVMREMLGREIMIAAKFYFIGLLATEFDPVQVLTTLVELLKQFLPYVTKGISAGFISAIGYLVYHFANHYGTALSEDAKNKINALIVTVNALEDAKSDAVVENVITASKNMVQQAQEVIEILTEETVDREELMKKIREGLTYIPVDRTGEIADVMSIDQLRQLDAPAMPPAPAEGANQEDDAAMPPAPVEGGSKHKKKTTQKRKKNSSIKKNKSAKKSGKKTTYRKHRK